MIAVILLIIIDDVNVSMIHFFMISTLLAHFQHILHPIRFKPGIFEGIIGSSLKMKPPIHV